MGNTGRGVLRKYVNGVNVTIAQFRLAKGSVVKPHSHRHDDESRGSGAYTT
jgi:quercetin dioxygenase-like cupin family protein